MQPVIVQMMLAVEKKSVIQMIQTSRLSIGEQ